MKLTRSALGLGSTSLLVLVLCFSGGPACDAADALARQASWQPLDTAQTIDRLRQSLDQAGLDPQRVDTAAERLRAMLDQDDADLLTAFVTAIAEVMPAIAQFMESVTTLPTGIAREWQESGSSIAAAMDHLPVTITASARALLARELTQRRLYDEALPLFEDIEATDSVDPAAVLFFRAVCRHSLLMKKESLSDLRRLLENEKAAPVRFTRTAHLMVADIQSLEEDSLDEIARLMTDVTRRLDLGRASEDVQQREQTIIDKLTKLIEKIEEQQRQQEQQQQSQQSSEGQSGGRGQGQPMDDSRIAGASGQGDVDRKATGDRDGWGNLPPAEREEALQQISRDLPTHYREAIEAYFRKLATDVP